MNIVPIADFICRTMGGRPNQMDVSIYAGCPFDCACGKSHAFDPGTIRVLRELPWMRLVLVCPEGEYLTCVKIKGWFRYRLESLFGTQAQPGVDQEEQHG